MRLVVLFLYICLGSSSLSYAQEPTVYPTASVPAISSSSAGALSAAVASAAEGQWQLTVDVIKSKADRLMQENNRLLADHDALAARLRTIHKSIAEQTAKNDQIRQFLKERRGKTDQQLKIEALERKVRAKKLGLPLQEQAADELRRRAETWEQKVGAKRLQISEHEWKKDMAATQAREAATRAAKATVFANTEVGLLRKQLEMQKAQEEVLQNELQKLRTDSDDAQVVELQKQVNALLDEKKQLQAKVSSNRPLKVEQRMQFAEVRGQKAELQARITDYESAMAELKVTALTGASWVTRRRKLMHEIVLVDARNAQLRNRISNIRQDIEILKTQVEALEHKLKAAS